jgi:hypothetical protein
MSSDNFSYVFLQAAILLMHAGICINASASELIVKEASYYTIEAETLVPITIDTIWQYHCRKKLSRAEEYRWNKLFGQFTLQKGIVFDYNRVRVGIRVGDRQFFIDANLILRYSDGSIRRLPKEFQRNKLKSFVNTNLRSCEDI